MAIDFEYKNDFASRKGYRATAPGLKIIIDNYDELFPVKDISRCGVAFDVENLKLFRKEQKVSISLVSSKRIFLADLAASVVWVSEKKMAVACEFINIGEEKELILDKLVLELQKREIIRREEQRNKEELNNLRK